MSDQAQKQQAKPKKQPTDQTKPEQIALPENLAFAGLAGLLALQNAAGNQAVDQLLQNNQRKPADNDHRGGKNRSLPAITIEQGRQAQETLADANAHAAARDSQILAAPEAFQGIEGKIRLAHEVAHTLQQHSPHLPRATVNQAEADAQTFASSIMSGVPASVNVSAPVGWAYDRKEIEEGDRVEKIIISGRRARVFMKGPKGSYQLTYTVKHNLPPRAEPYTIINGFGVPELPKEYKARFVFQYKKGDPVLERKYFPAKVELIVRKKGSPLSHEEGAGGRKRKGGKSKSRKKDAGPGKGREKGKTKASKESGKTEPGVDPKGAKDKAPPGGAPSPPPDAKVPIVTVTDIKQIEILKKRGLIPVETADKIKAKLEKNEPLTFEEALELVDGLNKFVAASDKNKDPEAKKARESWLKWAKFVKDNKDKISGRVKSGGDKPITVDEVKEIIKKHKEFVGIKDAPAKKTKDVVYDPELRKSWNSLANWEKKLWEDYLKKYGDTADVTDGTSKDLKITKAVRFSMALRMSPQYMKPGAREAAQQLFNDPIFIGGTIAGITAYLLLWMAPEPVFTKAAAVLTTIGLMSLVAFSASEIMNLAGAWIRLNDESAKATTLPELEKAAEHFGKSIGGSGLRILVALATVIAGKALPTPKPLPPGGGSGLAAATAGGPEIAVSPAATAIRVLSDGTILIVGGPTTGTAMSSVKSAPGSSSKPTGKGSSSKGSGAKKPPSTKKSSKPTKPGAKPTKNVYPDFERVPTSELPTARAQAAALAKKLGIPIPKDRILQAPWIGRIRGSSGKPRSVSTSEGWLRNESRFWTKWKAAFPEDAKLLGKGNTVTKELAKKYGWPTEGPKSVVGEKLIHHHMENGPNTVAVPKSLHEKLSGEIHATPKVEAAPTE
ncbi:MAG: DUF4157 domain-containing protein [Anaerolineae bacterium]